MSGLVSFLSVEPFICPNNCFKMAATEQDLPPNPTPRPCYATGHLTSDVPSELQRGPSSALSASDTRSERHKIPSSSSSSASSSPSSASSIWWSYIVILSTDGRLFLLRPHQVNVTLVMTHLSQSTGDVGLFKHLRGQRSEVRLAQKGQTHQCKQL